MSKKSGRSGSVRAQLERKAAYRAKAGPVSNPGQPSPSSRRERRAAAAVAKERAMVDQLVDGVAALLPNDGGAK